MPMAPGNPGRNIADTVQLQPDFRVGLQGCTGRQPRTADGNVMDNAVDFSPIQADGAFP